MEILHGVIERGAEPIVLHSAIGKLANRRLPALLDTFLDRNQSEGYQRSREQMPGRWVPGAQHFVRFRLLYGLKPHPAIRR